MTKLFCITLSSLQFKHLNDSTVTFGISLIHATDASQQPRLSTVTTAQMLPPCHQSIVYTVCQKWPTLLTPHTSHSELSRLSFHPALCQKNSRQFLGSTYSRLVWEHNHMMLKIFSRHGHVTRILLVKIIAIELKVIHKHTHTTVLWPFIWVEQGLTSNQGHIIGHIRDGFLRDKWPNQQRQSTEGSMVL